MDSEPPGFSSPKTLRVLHVISSLHEDQGGPARSVPQLALALAETSTEVAVWSNRPLPHSLPDLGDRDTSKLRIEAGSPSALIDHFRPHLVHDHGIWLPFHHRVAALCNRRGLPRIVSPHGMLKVWAMRQKRLKKMTAWHLYQRSDLQSAVALHATAKEEEAELRMLGLSVPTVIVPNGVHVPPWRERMDGGGERTMLFLGRLHEVKGLDLLVEAWRRVQPSNWRMRVVGPDEGGYRSYLQQLIDQAGLQSTWSINGPAVGAEKWAALAKADVLILPSHSENFGIVVAEALAAGVPVIATTNTPWSGLHTHECGWQVPTTVDGLEQALREGTSTSFEQRAAMGRRGRQWVERAFSWPAIAATMNQHYLSILADVTLARSKGRRSWHFSR